MMKIEQPVARRAFVFALYLTVYIVLFWLFKLALQELHELNNQVEITSKKLHDEFEIERFYTREALNRLSMKKLLLTKVQSQSHRRILRLLQQTNTQHLLKRNF